MLSCDRLRVGFGGRLTMLQAELEAIQAKQASFFREDSLWSSVHKGNLEATRDELRASPDRISSRGGAQETLLHAAYLSCEPGAIDVAHWLAEQCPELVGAAYESAPFAGETALHIAIAQHSLDEVRYLLDRDPSLVLKETTGWYFQSHDDWSNCFGSSPLSFAAGFNRGDVVEELILARGAMISHPDAAGNTAAHIAVAHGHIAMYDLLEALWSRGYGRPRGMESTPLSSLCNGEKMSPIVLAAALGRVDVFNHLWAKSVKPLWRWGHQYAVALPLDHIDSAGSIIHREADLKASPRSRFTHLRHTMTHSILPVRHASDRGETAPPVTAVEHHSLRYEKHAPTALEMIVQHEHEALLMSPDMVKLLHVKWSHFGRYVFGLELSFMLVFLVTFAAAAALRTLLPPDRKFLTCPPGVDDSTCAGTCACEGILTAQTAFLVIMNARRLWRSGGRLITARGAGEWNHVLSFCLWVSMTIAIALDAAYGAVRSRVAFSVASITSWSFLLWFLLGFRSTGPFIIVLHHMVVRDLTRFLFLLIVIMLGFTQAFLFLSDYSETTDAAASPEAVAGEPIARGDTPAKLAGARFGYVMRDLFIRFLEHHINDPSTDRYQLLPSIMFALLASVLLHALLVGMLDHTLTAVLQKSEHQWQLERARIMLGFEEDVPAWMRRLPFTQYWQLHEGRPHLQQVRKDEAALGSEERNAVVATALNRASALLPKSDGVLSIASSLDLPRSPDVSQQTSLMLEDTAGVRPYDPDNDDEQPALSTAAIASLDVS